MAHVQEPPTITITVEGPAHTGKTLVSARIARTLEAEGLTVEVQCPDGDYPSIVEKLQEDPSVKLSEIITNSPKVNIVEQHQAVPSSASHRLSLYEGAVERDFKGGPEKWLEYLGNLSLYPCGGCGISKLPEEFPEGSGVQLDVVKPPALRNPYMVGWCTSCKQKHQPNNPMIISVGVNEPNDTPTDILVKLTKSLKDGGFNDFDVEYRDPSGSLLRMTRKYLTAVGEPEETNPS